MYQIHEFQYYLPVQLPRKTYHLKSKVQWDQVVHKVYALLAKLEGTGHAPVLMQQVTHQHPDRSAIAFRPCFGKFVDITGKIHNGKQTKHKKITSKTVFFSRKVMMSI